MPRTMPRTSQNERDGEPPTKPKTARIVETGGEMEERAEKEEIEERAERGQWC